MILSVEGLRPPVRKLYNELVTFLDEHVYPNEKEIMEIRPEPDRWTVHPLLEQLKVTCFLCCFLCTPLKACPKKYIRIELIMFSLYSKL